LEDGPSLARWSSMELTPFDLENEVFSRENSNKQNFDQNKFTSEVNTFSRNFIF